MNRRTAALRQDGSSWSYGYNTRGEVTSAAKEGTAQIPEPGKKFGFAFDGLGNRTSSTVSSLANPAVLRSTGYTANALNQYEEITHPSPGWLVLRGRVNAQSSVTIDGNAPTLLSGGRWHHEQSVDNSAGAVRRVAEVTAMRPNGGTNNAAVTARHKGALFIPPPVEVVTHDDDGNQTSNAHWSYTWDGENRLIAAEESLAILLQPPGSGPVKRQRVECAYDAQGRRIYKRVLTAEGMSTTFILKQSVVFLYDGWNMIAEIDTTTSARLIRSYEWGLDVSGTMDGAGGVGGLLVLRTHPSTINSQPSTGAHAPTYDGNGNVMELVNLANGSVSARYEYGAFGETISVDGSTVAEANPFRFSTKYLDGETGLLYYGYRYYNPETGRWLSRDPLGDMAFRQMQMQAHGSTAFGDLIARKLTANEREQLESPYGEGIDWASAFIPSVESGLYRFAGNNPISMIDILGLLEYWELEGNYPTPTNYPTDPLSSNSIWKLIGGKVQQNGESGTFRNSCAIRMSHALNASGVLISSASGPVSSGMNPPKWWYIYRVENLKTFLRQKFGAPETFTPADFKKNCKKGIVIFNMTGDGFTGHADLWDGSTTIDGHDDYIDASSSVLFWEVQGN